MRRAVLALLLALVLPMAVPAQVQQPDSICLAVYRADSTAPVLLRQCLTYLTTVPSAGVALPVPLPGTGRKAQAVAALDSARWYSRLNQTLDSARADLTDSLGTRTSAEKVQSAAQQIQQALATAWTQITAWLDRALVLIDAPPAADTPPPVEEPPPADTTPTPTPTPVPPPAAGVALPQALPPVPAALATAACTRQVTSNLQGALNAAADGDVLCLTGTFVGNFTLPARGSAGWVVVRSAASVAAPGVRLRPSLAGPLATVQGVGVAPTFQTSGAARGWYLRELNIAAESTTTTVYSLVNVAKGARDIALDRVWVHPPANRQNQRCVIANGAAVTVINSWLGDCHGKGFDSQAIITWDSPGPLHIENNTLQGAGENFMSGGADPTTAGLRPCDITFKRNHVWTPLSWGPPGASPTRWTRKNSLELKNACRVLIEANVFDGVWGDAQTGYALVLKSANQSGRCTWCNTSDVTVRYNLIVNASAPLNISGTVPGINPVDSATQRIVVEHNYAETLGPNVTVESRHLLFTGNSVDVTLRQNTWDRLTLNVGTLYTGSDLGRTTGTNWTIDHDLVHFGQYGVMGQWKPTTTPPGTVNLQVLGLCTYGARAKTGQLPNMTVVSSLAAGVAAGCGTARSVVENAVAGVVLQP